MHGSFRVPFIEGHLSASPYRLTLLLFLQLEGFFGDSSKYSDVNVRGLTLKLKAGKVTLNAMLCLVVKSADAGLIEDKLAKDGKIGNITVVVGSLKFTPLG